MKSPKSGQPWKGDEPLSVPYLERLLAVVSGDHPEWSSGEAEAVSVLKRMLRYMQADETYMLPNNVEALFDSLDGRGVPSWELDALRQVAVPKLAPVAPAVLDEQVLSDILNLTDLGFVTRGSDRGVEHNAELQCWLAAFRKLQSDLPVVWGIFKKHTRKLIIDTHGNGSEDAAWEAPALRIRLKGEKKPNLDIILYRLVHEIGHAYEDEFDILKLMDIYGPNHKPCASAYGEKNASEDFAETFAFHWLDPEYLKQRVSVKYRDMKARLSGAPEAPTPKIPPKATPAQSTAELPTWARRQWIAHFSRPGKHDAVVVAEAPMNSGLLGLCLMSRSATAVTQEARKTIPSPKAEQDSRSGVWFVLAVEKSGFTPVSPGSAAIAKLLGKLGLNRSGILTVLRRVRSSFVDESAPVTEPVSGPTISVDPDEPESDELVPERLWYTPFTLDIPGTDQYMISVYKDAGSGINKDDFYTLEIPGDQDVTDADLRKALAFALALDESNIVFGTGMNNFRIVKV